MLSGHCGARSALASLADTNFVGNNLSGRLLWTLFVWKPDLWSRLTAGSIMKRKIEPMMKAGVSGYSKMGFVCCDFGITKY